MRSLPVRNGTRGSELAAEVRRCKTCDLDRLAESACLADSAYESEGHGSHLDVGHATMQHFAIHDELLSLTTETLWPLPLHRKELADIGCWGGALRDHLGSVTWMRSFCAQVIEHVDDPRRFLAWHC
jgi:hypothetical protein